MNMQNSKSPEDLKLSDFVRSTADNGVFVSGSSTPDELTELRQVHEAYGVISLKAQMEIAWLDGKDYIVRDIAKLQDSLE